ncbi:(deoxy)nucleoside triphosphate pyrophosphohydrolase [Pedobacter sp. JCM 36344]|uniref:(deoxy)nucleoside triphosphate pyrophosphohydrolase n=1 Tax=Pedobacter sp. JCM 36344 TaxID=3374280 RepID=UPI00397DC6E8
MLEVICAIIVDHLSSKVFVAQRGLSMKMPLKFEFPGGKMELGETPSECLVREIKEELNLSIVVLEELSPNIHSYPEFIIKLVPFICHIIGGEIVLKEHATYLWLVPADLLNLDWAEADIPILKNYLASL